MFSPMPICAVRIGAGGHHVAADRDRQERRARRRIAGTRPGHRLPHASLCARTSRQPPPAMCTLRQRICSVGRGAAHRTWRGSHPPAVEPATSSPEDVASIRPIRRSLAKARASCWRRSCRATRCLRASPALASERGPTLLSQGQIALAVDNQLRSPRRNCGRDRPCAAVACRARPHVAFITFGVTAES